MVRKPVRKLTSKKLPPKKPAKKTVGGLRKIRRGKGIKGKEKYKVPSKTRNDREQQILEREEEVILEVLELGGSRKDASLVVGATYAALIQKIAKYPELRLLIEGAEAKGKIHHLKKMHKGSDDWRASAWMLERKWYKEYSSRNLDSFTKEQVMLLILRLSHIVTEEVPDTKIRARVASRIDALMTGLQSK